MQGLARNLKKMPGSAEDVFTCWPLRALLTFPTQRHAAMLKSFRQNIRQNTKPALVFLASATLFGLILVAFWVQDWQYSLPTPRPARLAQTHLGHPLRLAGLSALTRPADGRPLFLHFFNPSCPCSRFNLDHVRRLVHDHGTRVQFVAVIEGGTPRTVRNLPMPSVADADGAIARACGVYSTPQAVLLDAGGSLYYRGNYNTSRYCAGRSTEFARLALESLLASRPSAASPHAATLAYGCQLPSNPALPVSPGGGFVRFCRRYSFGLGRLQE